MQFKEWRSLFLKRFQIPLERSVRKVVRNFNIAEKAVFYFLAAIFIVSGIFLLWKVNSSFLVEVPTYGGSFTEGVVGNPRFINPVLAISEPDKNLTSLIYSGLVRTTPDGTVENDLAESLIISDNHLTYTVHIREDAHFQDGTPLTADDVIFTISKITDPIIKSPKRGNWDGVTIEKLDDRTIAFTLKQAYTPFIYNLTIGILPRYIWKNVSNDEFSFSQFNTLPIGSGPYKVESVERNTGGIPNYYKLVPFEDNVNKTPYIRNMIFKFYPSEGALIEAYKEHSIESLSGISAEKMQELDTQGSRALSFPLPRIFGVFFNQNQSKVLLNKEVRQALEIASPKKDIVDKVLGGYATVIDGPIPAGIYNWTEGQDQLSLDEKINKAKDILAKSGWKMNEETGALEKKISSGTIELSFSISTGDAPELRAVASELADAWHKLGAKIEILVFETGDLNQNVIRPRKFDALLFGEVIGKDRDLYPFWHSSQRADPGLNIALYANSKADKLLEDTRTATDPKVVESNYKAFAEELKSDIPAIFLYTPGFLYVVPEKVKALSLSSLSTPQDRFLGIRDWYIETDKVWKIFIN